MPSGQSAFRHAVVGIGLWQVLGLRSEAAVAARPPAANGLPPAAAGCRMHSMHTKLLQVAQRDWRSAASAACRSASAWRSRSACRPRSSCASRASLSRCRRSASVLSRLPPPGLTHRCRLVHSAKERPTRAPSAGNERAALCRVDAGVIGILIVQRGG